MEADVEKFGEVEENFEGGDDKVEQSEELEMRRGEGREQGRVVEEERKKKNKERKEEEEAESVLVVYCYMEVAHTPLVLSICYEMSGTRDPMHVLRDVPYSLRVYCYQAPRSRYCIFSSYYFSSSVLMMLVLWW